MGAEGGRQREGLPAAPLPHTWEPLGASGLAMQRVSAQRRRCAVEESWKDWKVLLGADPTCLLTSSALFQPQQVTDFSADEC